MEVNVIQIFLGMALLAFECNVLAFNVEHNRGTHKCQWCHLHYAEPINKRTEKGEIRPACPRCRKFL